MKTPKLCPCGSKLKYAICCRKFHKGKLNAPTAEALMRSRFSAYVVNNPQYIYRTWAEETRPSLQSLREEKSENFIALEVLSTQLGGTTDKEGIVEFIATFKVEDKTYEHREKSTFRRSKNRWVYVNAI